MSGLPPDCHFEIFDWLTTTEKLLARGVCSDWRFHLEHLLSKETVLSTTLPHSIRKGLFWSPCSGGDHKRTQNNTIGSTWKANDLQKLVSDYFPGLKSLFVYNVEFCSPGDLVNFVDTLCGLEHLEHLEFAFCTNISTLGDATNLGATFKLSHFTAVRNFGEDSSKTLAAMLMPTIKTLTKITLDTSVLVANSDDLISIIEASPVDSLQIVNGQVDYKSQSSNAKRTIRNFIKAAISMNKISKYSKLDNVTKTFVNSSIKELSMIRAAILVKFTELTKLNFINEYVTTPESRSSWIMSPDFVHVAQPWTSLLSPDVWTNLITFRIGLTQITGDRISDICDKLCNLKHLALGSLDGMLEDAECNLIMYNKRLDSELLQISKLQNLTHLELNFTGILDETLIQLVDALNLKSISLIGCYRLRDLDAIFKDRKIKVIRKSNLLKNVHVMTYNEAVDYRKRESQSIVKPCFLSHYFAAKYDMFITRNFNKIKEHPPLHWSVDEMTNGNRVWKATLIGPKRSIYKNKNLSVTIKFDNKCLEKPPQIMFKSEIFHPNFIRNKNVKLEMLKAKNWSASTNVEMVLKAISDLLTKPCLTKVVNHEAAYLFENDKDNFRQRAQEL